MADTSANGYGFPSTMELLIRTHYPERTDEESAIIRDFLIHHLAEYDRYEFSRRVGVGIVPDPKWPANVQRQAVQNSRKRIDMLGWQGRALTIFEVKKRIGPGVLGQLETYADLYLEEDPTPAAVRLAAIGRYSDEDTLRVLRQRGIDVYLYEPSDAE